MIMQYGTFKKYRSQKIVLALSMAVIVTACKTASTRSRGGSAASNTANSANSGNRAGGDNGAGNSEEKGIWNTPLNLVDIDAPVQDATKVVLAGDIERIFVDDPTDVFSSGIIEVLGMRVVIPANLIIQMPVQRYTLQELFTNARPECKAKVPAQTGLALSDDCFYERRAGVVTITANRTGTGAIVAGDVVIAKTEEFVTGVVTYIEHTQGYFRLNGNTSTDNLRKSTGVMVRISDPDARHTVQSGLGCEAVNPANPSHNRNCNPDKRFPVDSDNYTVGFITGYPLCIPSTKAARTLPALPGVTHTTVSFNAATGAMSGIDSHCPFTNRPADPTNVNVADSKYFAPIRLGDQLDATGNFERMGLGVNRATFLAAHTIKVHAGLQTRAGQPDYLIFAETIWEVAGFPRARNRSNFMGFSTDRNSQLDLYRLSTNPDDPDDGSRQQPVPMGSTVNNPATANLGVAPNAQSIFRLHYVNIFGFGATARRAPCIGLENAGLPNQCTGGATTDDQESFKVMQPVTREVVVKTRNKTANPLLKSYDLSGNETPNGQYLSPAGLDHPEFVEINLNRLQTPHIFTGEPWNLDRKLGPQGCDGAGRRPCGGPPIPLKPFPVDFQNATGKMDPTQQNVAGFNLPQVTGNRSIMGFGYDNVLDGPVLDWAAADTDTSVAPTASHPVLLNTCVNSL